MATREAQPWVCTSDEANERSPSPIRRMWSSGSKGMVGVSGFDAWGAFLTVLDAAGVLLLADGDF